MNKLVHSFWTKPAIEKRWGEEDQLRKNIWNYATSACYAHQLGIPIELHTDYYGAELLEDLPYNKVYITLENFNHNRHFWAGGKFEAYKYMNEGDIHIDGDVFIKTRMAQNALSFNGYDAVFQNWEWEGDAKSCYWEGLNAMMKKTTFPEWFDISLNPINCGVVGFNNMKLKHEYIDAYFEYTDRFKDCKDDSSILVLEQWFISSLLKKHESNVKFVFDENSDKEKQAVEMGYQHILGKAKYDEENMQHVYFFLKNLDINLHNHIIEKYKQNRF